VRRVAARLHERDALDIRGLRHGVHARARSIATSEGFSRVFTSFLGYKAEITRLWAWRLYVRTFAPSDDARTHHT
jgi:hypothetical protein